MVTSTGKHYKYDNLAFSKKLRVTGLTQTQAEAIAEGTGQLGEVVVAQIMESIDQRAFAKKSDLDIVHFELKAAISEVRVDAKNDNLSLREELKHDIILLREELKHDIVSLREELLSKMDLHTADNALLRSELMRKSDVLSTELTAEKVLIRTELREVEERITKNLQLFMLKTSFASIIILCGAMFSMFKLML